MKMPRKGSTSDRGYGLAHQQRREFLLYNLVDGSPCWWCGKPMFKDKNLNFDGLSLHADHSDPISRNSRSYG